MLPRALLGMTLACVAACARAGAPEPLVAAPAPSPAAPRAIEAPARADLPVPPGSAAPAQRDYAYTMDDLAALERDRAWVVLAEHLRDIPPSRRDPEWDRLLVATGKALFDGASSDEAFQRAEKLLERYPTLSKSSTVMAQRASVGLEYFRRCYEKSRTGAPCTEGMLAFVRADEDNGPLAVDAAHLAMRNQLAATGLLFFHVAVVGKRGRLRECSDPELFRALAAAEGGSEPSAILDEARTIRNACSKQ